MPGRPHRGAVGGQLALSGRVSVRTLRHHDATGLLRPAHADPATGYRDHTAAQLARLNRVIALKNLGCTLRRVEEIVDDKVGPGELRGMLRLRLRRAELKSPIASSRTRLIQVKAGLRASESQGDMPTHDLAVKSVPSLRVAEPTATAASHRPEGIAPVVGPLYDELFRRLGSAGIAPAGPGVAYYGDAPEGAGRISVHTAVQVSAPVQDDPFRVLDLPRLDLPRLDLPPLDRAATIVPRGSMHTVHRPDPGPLDRRRSTPGRRDTPVRSTWSARTIATTG